MYEGWWASKGRIKCAITCCTCKGGHNLFSYFLSSNNLPSFPAYWATLMLADWLVR
jgi:hypothetical protein